MNIFFKKFLNKVNSTSQIIIVVGILTVLNFFSANIFYRFDLTQNRDYSISRASKKTVSGLKDVVNIQAYFSANLPPQYLTLKQEVGDILEEYSNYSNGRLNVEFIDPKDNEDIEQELYLAGVPRLQFNVLEKDKYQVVNGYLGMLIKYGGKTQAIPIIEDTRNFEYQVTAMIKKLTSEEIANVGFWQGNGALSAQNEAAAAFNKLKEIYNASVVNFASDKKIKDDLDTLIIIGPKEKFTEEELRALDAFLMKGGSLVILADGVKVDQGLKASPNAVGLDKIFDAYGLKLNNDLVLDVNNGLASFSQGFISFSANYPYWPKVVKAGFDQSGAATSKLESLILPWASSLEINADKTKDLRISYLARTTDKAMAVKDNINLSPQGQISGGTNGQFILALSAAGKFNSAFNQPNQNPGRLILAGDSDFINDNFLRNSPDNLTFFQNIVDSLSLGDDLISIRSEGVTERPLKEISEQSKAAIRYLNIFGLTAIVVVFGLARYYFRRRNRLIDGI